MSRFFFIVACILFALAAILDSGLMSGPGNSGWLIPAGLLALTLGFLT